MLGSLFDLFSERPDSPLVGLTSSAARASGKLSRVTFNSAVKPLISAFGDNDTAVIFDALRGYLTAASSSAQFSGMSLNITNPTVFRAVMLLFPELAQRVKDRFGAAYSDDNFFAVFQPLFGRLKANTFKNPGNSIKELHQVLAKALKEDFTL